MIPWRGFSCKTSLVVKYWYQEGGSPLVHLNKGSEIVKIWPDCEAVPNEVKLILMSMEFSVCYKTLQIVLFCEHYRGTMLHVRTLLFQIPCLWAMPKKMLVPRNCFGSIYHNLCHLMDVSVQMWLFEYLPTLQLFLDHYKTNWGSLYCGSHRDGHNLKFIALILVVKVVLVSPIELFVCIEFIRKFHSTW